MKTIENLKSRRLEVELEIRLLNQKTTWDKHDKTYLNKLYKEISLIDLCMRYIETSIEIREIAPNIAIIEQ